MNHEIKTKTKKPKKKKNHEAETETKALDVDRFARMSLHNDVSLSPVTPTKQVLHLESNAAPDIFPECLWNCFRMPKTIVL